MKIREFLRLRRQQDAVKIIILYVIAIGVCCGFLIRDGLRYAQITRTKEEFKLIGNDQVLTDSKVQRVREIEGVTDVSYDVSDSGIAGGLGLADEEVMKAVAGRREKDLEALGADVIVSACAAEKAGLEAGGGKVESLLCYAAAL